MRPDFFYDSHKLGTMKLEHYLSKFNSFDEFEKQFPQEFLDDDCRVGDYLRTLWIKDGARPVSVVSEEAYQDTSYLRKIINNRNENPKTPKRDALICFCIAMKASIEDLQCVLKYAGYQPLYARRRKDVVIWYGIMKHENILTIDDNLRKRGLQPIISDKKLGPRVRE